MTGLRGLRRFVDEPAEPVPAPAPVAPPVETCEMCAVVLDPRHGHVVDLEHRSLKCTCRACYLLFTSDEAGGRRYRAVPDRYLTDPDSPLSKAEWDGLGVPVGSAFFLRGENGVAGFYPSPAGATECLLDLAAWAELAGRHPLLGAARPDVEAVLIRADGESGVQTYLVPIDACYELVGLVRTYWKGFDGGQEARERIDGFFAGVRERAAHYVPEA